MTHAELDADYHARAREFEKTLRDCERGGIGVFPVHHWCNGRPLPDYRQCIAVTFGQNAEQHAEEQARRRSAILGVCCVCQQL